MNLVPRSSVLRSIGGVGGAAVLSQLLALAATPFMSRLFTQAELGRYSLFFSLANVLVTLALLGLTDAIIAADSHDDAVSLLAACTRLIALMTPVLCLVTLAIIRLHVLGYGALPLWSALPMAIEVAAIAAIMTLQAWLIRVRRFRIMAVGHVALGAFRSAGPVLAGFARAGFGGLVMAEVAARTALTVILARPLRADLASTRRRTTADSIRIVRRYRLFPIFRTPSTFANNLGTALPPTLVTMIYGLATAGDYALMSSVMVAPSALIQRAVGDVFLGHFADAFRRDQDEARVFLLRVAAALIAIALIPCAILLLWGPPIFAFAFGERWRAAGVLASIMAPALIGELAISPLGSVLSVVNRPDAKLLFDLTRIVGYGCTYLITTSESLPPTGMVALLARFSILSYAIYAVLIWMGARHPRRVTTPTVDLQAISN